MYSATAARCVECTDTHICVYSSTGTDKAPNTWCYGKDPTMVGNIYIPFLTANRLPYYNYQYCIDCNTPLLVN